MTRSLTGGVGVLVSVLLCVSPAPGQTVRVSVAGNGEQALGGTWVAGSSVAASADGRVIVFDSPLDTLVPGDTNDARDVFVSVDGALSRAVPAGLLPNGPSGEAVSSADGMRIAFTSRATNLLPGDASLFPDVFVFDRATDTVILASPKASGGFSTLAWPRKPAISANGRYVAFISAGDHVANTPASRQLAYRRDLQTNETIVVSVDGQGLSMSGAVGEGGVAVSDTGEVVFTWCDVEFEAANPRGDCDAYVRNPSTGTTTRVSTYSTPWHKDATPGRVSISADGARVSYVARDSTGETHAIVVLDRSAKRATLASRALPGQLADATARDGVLSPNGRFLTFLSAATNLSVQPTGTTRLFRVDLDALTITSGVTPIGVSSSARALIHLTPNAAITDDGTVFALSDADDLVSDDTNHNTDLFRIAPDGTVSLALPLPATAGRSYRPATNHDGSVVAFISTAANLTHGDDNQVADAFVKDMVTGVLERLQPQPQTTPATHATWVALSDDGRYVTLSQDYVWLHDRILGAWTKLGRTLSGGSQPGLPRVAISGDGRYVAFTTFETLDPGDTNVHFDVYVYDRVSGSRRLVSLRDDGTQLWNEAYHASISGDGRVVSFIGRDFDSTGVSGERVFVRDRDADGNGVFDEPKPGATRTHVHQPISPDLLATAATMSRDGRRVLSAHARALDGTVFVTDHPATGVEGSGHSLRMYTQPYDGIRDVPNVPGVSANGRLFTWTRTNAPFTNVPVRPYIGLSGFGAPEQDFSAAPGGQPCTGGAVRGTANPAISGNGRVLVFESGCVDLVSGDTNGMADVFLTPTGVADAADAAPGYRSWVESFDLDPDSAAGSPWVDSDGDGLSNLAEFAAAPQGVPTLGRYQRYFAEGATSTPGLDFTTRIALANPHAFPVRVRIEYAPSSGSVPATEFVLVPYQRTTITANELPGLEAAEFGFRVLATHPIGVDRTMTWNANVYAGHGDAGAPRASLTWYFAEGATIAGFQLFYLLQNPSPTDTAIVEGRFLLATGHVVTRQYTVAPGTRFNIWANEERSGDDRPLADQELSAVFQVVSGPPVVAERAMYRDLAGTLFKAGHESSGVVTPSTSWFLAAGNAGEFFDFYVLVANPSSTDASLQVDYMLGSGQVISRTVGAPANSRLTMWVDELEEPAGSGLFPFRHGNTDISVRVTSLNDVGIVVERAMWWPGDASQWREAHNTAGATATSPRWIVAEGEVSNPPAVAPGQPPVDTGAWDTYVLIANTGAHAGTVRITLMLEGRLTVPIVASHTQVEANSRTTFSLRDLLATAGISAARAAVLVESVGGDLPLVVERAMYRSRQGQFDAGMNGLGTPLTP